jgi:hypothetical protein
VVRKLLVWVCILVQISAYETRNQLFALNHELFSWCQWSLCTSAITMLWSQSTDFVLKMHELHRFSLSCLGVLSSAFWKEFHL